MKTIAKSSDCKTLTLNIRVLAILISPAASVVVFITKVSHIYPFSQEAGANQGQFHSFKSVGYKKKEKKRKKMLNPQKSSSEKPLPHQGLKGQDEEFH